MKKEDISQYTTEEAAMEADVEVPASQQQLQDLVKREAMKVADKQHQGTGATVAAEGAITPCAS
jgi:hypothetical protein